MKQQQTFELLGYIDILKEIEEKEQEIEIFEGLIEELLLLGRSSHNHKKALNSSIFEKEVLRLTLLN